LVSNLLKKTLVLIAILLITLLLLSSCKNGELDEEKDDNDKDDKDKEEKKEEEPEIEVEYTINLKTVPETLYEEEYFTVEWEVDSNVPAEAVSTSLFYGTQSDSQAFNEVITPDDVIYTDRTDDHEDGSFSTPATFTQKIQAPETGSIYLRAHVRADGMNYWTEEVEVETQSQTFCMGYALVDGVCCLDIETPFGECDPVEEEEETTVTEPDDTTNTTDDTADEEETVEEPVDTELDAALVELREQYPGDVETTLLMNEPIIYKNIIKVEVYYKIKSNGAPFSGGLCVVDLFGEYPNNVIQWQTTEKSFWKQAYTTDLPKGEQDIVVKCYDQLGRYQAQIVSKSTTIPE